VLLNALSYYMHFIRIASVFLDNLLLDSADQHTRRFPLVMDGGASQDKCQKQVLVIRGRQNESFCKRNSSHHTNDGDHKGEQQRSWQTQDSQDDLLENEKEAWHPIQHVNLERCSDQSTDPAQGKEEVLRQPLIGDKHTSSIAEIEELVVLVRDDWQLFVTMVPEKVRGA